MENLTVINKEIEIPGLQKTYRILHVTDAHVIAWNKQDEESIIVDDGPHNGKKLVSGFGAMRARHFTVEGVSTNDKFMQLCDFLEQAGTSFTDAVVFTGDILDFYTDTAFEFMMEQLNKLPMPYMFVLGNHDYIFSNHSAEETFDRFAKVCGGSYKIQKMTLGELTLVGSFNGEYFYDDETLELIASAIQNEDHVLLFQHVPIDSPSFDAYTKEKGTHNVVIGAKNCPCQSDSRERILQLIEQENSPIRALICGDSHFDYSGPLTDRVTQYVSPLLRDFPPVLFTVKGS